MLLLIIQGKAKILQKPSDTEAPVEVGRLGPSDYFGKFVFYFQNNILLLACECE